MTGFPGLVVQKTLRGVSRAKKQAQRGKLARYVAGRVRSAEKSLDLSSPRHTRRPGAAARGDDRRRRPGTARAPPDGRRLRRVDRQAAHRARQGAGARWHSIRRARSSAECLATSRRLFEIKKAKIAEQMAGFDQWDAKKQAKFLTRKQSFYRHLLKDEDLRRNPDLVDFALSDALLGPVTRYPRDGSVLTRWIWSTRCRAGRTKRSKASCFTWITKVYGSSSSSSTSTTSASRRARLRFSPPTRASASSTTCGPGESGTAVATWNRGGISTTRSPP